MGWISTNQCFYRHYCMQVAVTTDSTPTNGAFCFFGVCGSSCSCACMCFEALCWSRFRPALSVRGVGTKRKPQRAARTVHTMRTVHTFAPRYISGFSLPPPFHLSPLLLLLPTAPVPRPLALPPPSGWLLPPAAAQTPLALFARFGTCIALPLRCPPFFPA